jgi:hypothetical protein
MSVESYLTRELDIRFIDARNIVTEAKVSLGIRGYPSKDQLKELTLESMRLFEIRPEAQKTSMRRMSSDLESVKIPVGSLSSRAYDLEDSDGSSNLSGVEFNESGKTKTQQFSRKVSLSMLTRRSR